MPEQRGTTPSSAYRRALYVPPPKRPQREETFEEIPVSLIHQAALQAKTDPETPTHR